MTLEEKLELSYYQEVAPIKPEHGITLVQDNRTQKFYVKKVLTVYSREVYIHLWRHPISNTPKIYFVAENDGELVIIEEYIPGETLEEILAKGNLREDQVIAITVGLCRIIEAFHNCNPAIINRDIKPSNIKISPDGVVKLVDMNAAKLCNTAATRDTMLIGTQGYAAPEQYGFGASSVLTDIYSIGVLMNVMLTGELPGVVLASGKLKYIITRCVELSPKNRFQSVHSLRAALLTLQGKQIENVPVTGWRKYMPPGLRNSNPVKWLLAIAGYAFLLFLTMGIIVENATPLELWINRIACTVAALGVVLFSGNYLGVQETLPLTRTPQKVIRWIAIAVVDVVIFVACVIICSVVESILF